MAQARCLIQVRGLDCAAEIAAVRAALAGAPGVADLAFDLLNGQVAVTFDPATTSPQSVARRIAEAAGFETQVVGEALALAHRLDWEWILTALSGLGLAIGVGLQWWGRSDWRWEARAAFAIAIAASGSTLLPKALRSARQLRLDIHVLMTIGVLGALLLGQWDEAATVAFLFGLSEALEGLSLAHARRAVRALLEITPETAEVVGPDGTSQVVAASHVRVGQHLRVRAGDRIPIDGRVLNGRSSVDQKAVTGESVPVLREPGDEVFAGTVNGEGALEIEAIRPLGDAVVTRIVDQVRAAQAGKAPLERTIERFAAKYTPMVVALAVAVMLVPALVNLATGAAPNWSLWIYRGLVVLVTACPCALVISTPVAIVSALAAGARHGVLIKGGQHLEAIGRLRVLAFDKTGTLTRGEPDVVEVVSTAGTADEDVLRIAAALGDRGGHVLGRAIARHARGLRLDVPVAHDYKAVPGLGATGRVETTQYHIGSHRFIDEAGLCPADFHDKLGLAEGHVGTAVALTAPSGPVGWIRLADRPRPEASGVLAELKRLGLETVMLTGDNHLTAEAMARELGISEQRSGLLPADKAAAIADLDSSRGPAGMVGDGVNDAPALAAARVSVALGGVSSGAALETADIVLMADDLSRLPWLVRHSRKTLAIIRQNIALAVVSKVLVLALAVVGLANLWLAIAADVGVSLLVVANALRLLRAE
jgi:Cd2+/Zn2+-exporting ATPase